MDVGLGAPIRAAELDDLGLRVGYYVALMVLAVVMRLLPGITAWAALAESTVNLLLLFLGVLLPLWDALDGVAAGGPEPGVLTGVQLVNLVLSGSVTILAIKGAEGRLRGGR